MHTKKTIPTAAYVTSVLYSILHVCMWIYWVAYSLTHTHNTIRTHPHFIRSHSSIKLIKQIEFIFVNLQPQPETTPWIFLCSSENKLVIFTESIYYKRIGWAGELVLQPLTVHHGESIIFFIQILLTLRVTDTSLLTFLQFRRPDLIVIDCYRLVFLIWHFMLEFGLWMNEICDR